MSQPALRPSHIIATWETKLQSLSKEHRIALMKVVRYCLPPPAAPALTLAADILAIDDPDADHRHMVNLAIPQLDLSAMPSLLATQYPLYVAMTDTQHAGDTSAPMAKVARHALSSLFVLEADDGITPSVYYSQILHARTVARLCILFQPSPATTEHSPLSTLFSVFASERLRRQREHHLSEYETVTQLLTGERQPGVPTRRITSRTPSTRQSRSRDAWQQDRLRALTMPPKAHGTHHFRGRHTQTGIDILETDHADAAPVNEARALGFREVSNTRRAQSPESSESPVYQRSTPSALTPRDDVQLVQRIGRAAAADSLASLADIHRLPPERIRRLLALEMSDELRVIAILIIATGIPPRRLARLELAHQDELWPADPVPHDDRPRWYAEQRRLAYPLLDGPSANGDGLNRWIALTIPRSLASALTAALTPLPMADRDAAADPEEHAPPAPIATLLRQLGRQLKRVGLQRAGITPTIARLHASSYQFRRPHAVDDVAAQLLTGSLGLGLAAPAAYRRVEQHELQLLFDAVLRDLEVIHDTEDDDAASRSHVGSAVAMPATEFTPVFNALRQAIGEARQKLRHWHPGEPLPRQTLTDMGQALAGYVYLGWLLATGARPLGPSSRNRLSRLSPGLDRMWIRDKSSAVAIETRVTPLISPIAESLEQHARWLDLAIAWWQRHGGSVDDRRCDDRDTPAWIRPTRGGNTLIIEPIEHAHLNTLYTRYPALAAMTAGWPDNICRHCVASALRTQLPDAEIDALLGHAHHGRSLAAPHATSPLGRQRDLRQALQTWLRRTGFRDLPWESLSC